MGALRAGVARCIELFRSMDPGFGFEGVDFWFRAGHGLKAPMVWLPVPLLVERCDDRFLGLSGVRGLSSGSGVSVSELSYKVASICGLRLDTCIRRCLHINVALLMNT